MGNNTYDLVQAFLDGFYTGADAIGTVIGYSTGDERHRGYQADRFGLIGTRKKMEFFGLNPRLHHIPQELFFREKERGLAEKFFKASGDITGLGLNVVTFGLLNTMFLGEVYCKDNSSRLRTT